MSKKVKVFLIVAVVAILMMLSVVIQIYSSIIPSNGINAVGNTAGNINNGGLFAQQGDRVYFSNSFDKGYVYSMNSDETDIVKVNGTPSSNILIGGDYMYYYMDTSNGGEGLGYVVKTSGLYRSRLDGKKPQCLERTSAINMQLVGDYIYYQRYDNKEYTKLYRIKTNKSDLEKVSDVVINPASANNGKIYFNGTEKDHYLYAMDTTNNSIYTIFRGNVWFPQFVGGYFYYLDLDKDMCLCRLDPDTQSVEILTRDRVEAFNVGNNYIYYQTTDATAPALKRMFPDGSGAEIVEEGVHNSINLTDKYVYFKKFGDKATLYHMPVDGPVSVSIFSNAMTAIVE